MRSTLSLIPFVALAVNAQFDALLGKASQLMPTIHTLDPQGIQVCLVATANADGAEVIVQDCSQASEAARTWTVVNGGPTEETPPAGPIKIFGNKCLDVTNGSNTNGNKLQIWTCDATNSNKNQLFNYGGDLSINWDGTTKCVDLTDGSVSNGNQVQIWDCVQRSPNQEWPGFAPPDLQTSLANIVVSAIGSNFMCISATSNADGAAVVVDVCRTDNGATTPKFPNSNDTWILPSVPLTGQISTFGNKCLDVKDGVNADGTTLQIWTCTAGDTNQLWKTSSDTTIAWSGKGKCVDLTGGNQTPGTPIQVWDCDNTNANQKWNYLSGD